jgi:hypothetical protein
MTLKTLTVSIAVAASLLFACDKNDDDVKDAGPDGGPGGSGGMGGSGGSPSGGSGGSDAGPVDPDEDGGSEEGLLGVTCDEAQTTDATALDSRLSGDLTLAGLYHVQDVTHLTNVDLTIEAGTTFIMDADTTFEIGWNSSDATVMALGTESLPIRFCARTQEAGAWGMLYLGNQVTSDSVLEHVIIENAGGDGAALQLEAGVRVTDVRVEGSGDDGVVASSFARNSERLSVVDAAGTAIVLTAPGALNELPLGGDFEDNGENAIRLTFRSYDVDTSIKAAAVHYVQEGVVNVHDVELSFAAGVDYRFAADGFLDIGWNGNETELHIDGQSAEPVVFQGAEPTQGYWRGIRVGSGVLSSSTIANAEVMHAGGLDTPALEIEARITLDGVTLEDNALGFVLAGPLQPGSKDLTVTGTQNGAPVVARASSLTSLPQGGSFTGNEEDEIRVEPAGTELLTGTVPNLGVPYHLVEDLNLIEGSDTTIAAGTEFLMGGGVELEVGWNGGDATLIAVGTSGEPIVFVGEQDTAGYWDGIVFNESATADSALDYVTIENAGLAGSAALRLERAIPVTNATIRSSAGAGIAKIAADATDYTATNTFTDVAQGSVITD